MSDYTPDRWVIIQIDEERKVLAGWLGGYLDSDHWRVSSYIQTIEDKGDHFIVTNQSGSVYKCIKGRFGHTTATAGIYRRLESLAEKKNINFSSLTIEEL